MNNILSAREWTQKKRTTKFRLYDLNKWIAQNNAEPIDCAEGCLIDNVVYACKRGIAFIFEEYANEWSSAQMVYFVPYKEQDTNKEYNKLWERFYSLIKMEEN